MNEKSKRTLQYIVSLMLLFVAGFVALTVGSEKLSFSDAFDKIILLNLRLPRIILATVTGALLAGAGAVFQLYFRNPLAEPSLMGVSSGATLGAVVATCATSGGLRTAAAVATAGAGMQTNATVATAGGGLQTFASSFLSPINFAAFLGALIAGIVIILLSSGKNNREATVMLLLCGTALGTLYSAISSCILLTTSKELHSIYTWILGSFNGRGWNELMFIAIPGAVAIVLFFITAPQLDLLAGGETTARTLGVEVNNLRLLVLISGALAVSCSVCAGGTISFVGLIAPHIVRRLFGPKAKVLIPFSMIFGAILLLLADTLARTVIAPSELPAGIITSILGVPFFISLLIWRNK